MNNPSKEPLLRSYVFLYPPDNLPIRCQKFNNTLWFSVTDLLVALSGEAPNFCRRVTSEVLPQFGQPGTSPSADDFIDLRGEPYAHKPVNRHPVRVIQYNGIDMYSLADVLRGIHLNADTGRTVERLAAQKKVAIKIRLYGSTRPAWFIDEAGLRLITAGKPKT